MGTPGGDKFEQEAPKLRTGGPMGAKWIPNGHPDPPKANFGSKFGHCELIFDVSGKQFVTLWSQLSARATKKQAPFMGGTVAGGPKAIGYRRHVWKIPTSPSE